MSSPLTLAPGHSSERPRRMLLVLGGALILATYLFLVTVQPTEIAGGVGSTASLVSLFGFLGGGALLVGGILPMLTTSSLVVMPLGIALNIAIGQIAGSLGMQIYLDAIGTVLVAVLAGPAAGAATGALSNAIWGLFNPFALPFAAGAALIGLLAGLAAKHGAFRRVYLAPVAGLVVGAIGGLVAAPVAVFMFGAAGTFGTNAIIAVFRSMGDKLLVAATKQGLLSDSLDKIVVFVIVALIVYALPQRAVRQFPFARTYRVLGNRSGRRAPQPTSGIGTPAA
ncbi:energy-coupling factor transport system substrate-specific component [Arthrobacter sp. PL16]|uniref:ECF transporter S component n=1 Tax=Arthrobacter cheniae TaxID=1258888 RepID=A0A3A5M310_9MICC|nr:MULTISPECIES: ECF transporter S component [Arthrobacter]MEC5200494.1 energy-coupling factor transport system substrate-specific component [Arthrobacter sp. PL16]RJT77325.1 ECF transporter S component [Arthrobacter cheniae]